VARRKPTRRDLLVVIGRLQDAIGRGLSAYDGEGRFRADAVHNALRPAFDLAVEALAQDPPLDPNTGPWGATQKGQASSSAG
jgi:hypothetical protein